MRGKWEEFNTSYCTETLEAVTAGMGHFCLKQAVLAFQGMQRLFLTFCIGGWKVAWIKSQWPPLLLAIF
jgi:hypothetical protein